MGSNVGYVQFQEIYKALFNILSQYFIGEIKIS